MTKTTILVVEDDRDIQELVSYNLMQEGFQVLRALTGEDGLRIAKTRKPGLVILDLMLPGMDGMEVCKRIQTQRINNETPFPYLEDLSDLPFHHPDFHSCRQRIGCHCSQAYLH